MRRKMRNNRVLIKRQMTSLQLRAVSSVVIVLLIVISLLSPRTFLLTVTLLEIVLLLEWASAIRVPPRVFDAAAWLGMAFQLGLVWLLRQGFPGAYLPWHVLACAALALLRRQVYRLDWDEVVPNTPNRLFVFGVVYISTAIYFLVQMYIRFGELFVLWIFILLWSTDTGAYFVGRALGRRKMAPRISPGKTWAGFWGGIAVATLVGSWSAGLAAQGALNAFKLIPFVVLVSVCAHMGDLVESAAKRRLGLKDMSDLIPGHGGFADRFDSLLLVSLVVGLLGLFVDGPAQCVRWPRLF